LGKGSAAVVGVGAGVAGAAAAALLFTPAALTGIAQAAAAAPAAASMPASNAADFVATVASSDKFEIRSSKKALTKANDPELKTFAERMIADHSASSAKLKATAKGQGIAVPKKMMPEQADTLKMVNHSKGTARLSLGGPGTYYYGSTTGNDEGRGLTGALVFGGEVPDSAKIDRPPQPRP